MVRSSALAKRNGRLFILNSRTESEGIAVVHSACGFPSSAYGTIVLTDELNQKKVFNIELSSYEYCSQHVQ